LKAVFVTTFPNDVTNVVTAWDFWNEKSERIVFDFHKPIDDADILRRAAAARPDIIFYIGGCGGPIYLPSVQTLRALREMAPSVNMMFDGADKPWHAMIEEYRRHQCFDLHVTIDGCLDCPADYATVAPVDTRLFGCASPARDIPCGISGNIGPCDQRSKIIRPLIKAGLVEMRTRDLGGDSFAEHVKFMQRCRMIINTSWTGSGRLHHVKQRVFETGFAGAALLECSASPTHNWIPTPLWYRYDDAMHAAEIIRNVDPLEVADRAALFAEYVQDHYTPQKVYGGILERVGL
jgi:hypothetical protein